MTAVAARMVCAGCGHVVPAGAWFPFRCPNADRGDDVDHVLRADLGTPLDRLPDREHPQPHVRFREWSFPYAFARAHGMTDAGYVALVEELDAAVARVDGQGFRETPFAAAPRLGDALSAPLWVKDETGNVAGSHKARHLMGVMIYLRVLERVQPAFRLGAQRLAIASCGNAALAAAVVARAAGAALEVFVPPDVHPATRAALERHGASVTVCPRRAGERGDPCYLRFREALREGALPFGCQGSDNGLTIDGGRTLGFEIVAALARNGAELDVVAVQVGGGALASAYAAAFATAHAAGAVWRLPRLVAVQTAAAAPLERAYRRVAERIAGRLGIATEDRLERAARILERVDDRLVTEELRQAATHRSEFMWPWESEPRSIAHGILDDETYDWLAVVEAMLRSGGFPVVVDEATLRAAHELAQRATGIPVEPTGTAGLAGLLALRDTGELARGTRAAVLFTGIERGSGL